MEVGSEKTHGMPITPQASQRTLGSRNVKHKAAIHAPDTTSLEMYKTAPVNFDLNNNLKSKESDKRAKGMQDLCDFFSPFWLMPKVRISQNKSTKQTKILSVLVYAS